MKRDTTQEPTLAGRLKDLEHFTGSLVARPRTDQDAIVIAINQAPLARVPVPRRSRVFLRSSGGGHGAFADLTLTAPRPALD